jgi:hypothetical protein
MAQKTRVFCSINVQEFQLMSGIVEITLEDTDTYFAVVFSVHPYLQSCQHRIGRLYLLYTEKKD